MPVFFTVASHVLYSHIAPYQPFFVVGFKIGMLADYQEAFKQNWQELLECHNQAAVHQNWPLHNLNLQRNNAVVSLGIMRRRRGARGSCECLLNNWRIICRQLMSKFSIHLGPLFHRVFRVSASSTPMERIFSWRMSDALLETLVFWSVWWYVRCANLVMW